MIRTCAHLFIAVCAFLLVMHQYRRSPLAWAPPAPPAIHSSIEEHSVSDALQLNVVVPKNASFQSDVERDRIQITTKEPTHVHVTIRRTE